jgi:hypothetical protein
MKFLNKKRFAFLTTLAAVLFFWRKKKKGGEGQAS